MALFDLNSRYTKSMEHGGSYERDASIGGYNRKELRGLNRQARRGTLTQRERARLKYLTDERGGRRKRGLLAGLGGVGATLGALAAAGKLGDGKGGAALMDAIKLRLAEGKEKRMRRRADPMEGISSLEAPKNVREEGLMESGPGIGEARRSVGADLVSDSTNRQEDLGHGEMTGLIDEMIERSNEDKQKADANKPARGTDPRDFSGELSESVGEGDLYEAQQEAERQARLARRPEFASGSNLDPYLMPAQRQDEFIPQGPIRGGMVPGPEGRSDTPGSHVQQALLEIARDEASRVSSENPLPTGITSTRRNTGPEVDLGSMLTQAELDAENALPGRIGERATRGSNRPNVSQLFKALNRSKPSEIDVDPEGLTSDQSPGAAQTLLNAYNEKRRELGLEPAIQLTKEMIEETEGAMDPRDRATPQLMTRRPPRQIFNRYR